MGVKNLDVKSHFEYASNVQSQMSWRQTFKSTATFECTLKLRALTPVTNDRKSTFP